MGRRRQSGRPRRTGVAHWAAAHVAGISIAAPGTTFDPCTALDASTADSIVTTFDPGTALDAGCPVDAESIRALWREQPIE